MAKQTKTTLTTRIIWILLGLFFVITVVSQLYINFNDPMKTEVARLYPVTNSVPFKGVFIRNERLVQTSNTGIIAYAHADGTKLAKNSIVAQRYNSQRDILLQAQIDKLYEQIQILEEAESLGNTDNSQLESFNNQISLKHTQLMTQLDKGNYDQLEAIKNDFLSLQCKRSMVRGSAVNYYEKKQQIRADIRALEAQISAQPQAVRIEEAGYFVSNVDGYEAKLNYDTIAHLTKEEILDIIQNPYLPVSDNVIGKMIDDYKWKFIGILDTNKTRSVFSGSTVRLRMGAGANEFNAFVEHVELLDDGSSVILFECDQLTSAFVEKRTAQFHLLLENYEGIRLPSSAIRFNEETGERGVFIKNGVQIQFVQINELMVEEDFVLVENTTDLAGYISLYDTIVVSGKDLYHGKIVYD